MPKNFSAEAIPNFLNWYSDVQLLLTLNCTIIGFLPLSFLHTEGFLSISPLNFSFIKEKGQGGLWGVLSTIW